MGHDGVVSGGAVGLKGQWEPGVNVNAEELLNKARFSRSMAPCFSGKVLSKMINIKEGEIRFCIALTLRNKLSQHATYILRNGGDEAWTQEAGIIVAQATFVLL